jgi:hypothetical protein
MIVHASGTADGATLLLVLIVEGKTNIVEGNQIGAVGTHSRFQTENGWPTPKSFAHCLRLLWGHLGRGKYSGDRIRLITDFHEMHATQAVRQTAEELNIELICIPPLGGKVSGPLKSKAKHEYRMGLKRGENRGK